MHFSYHVFFLFHKLLYQSVKKYPLKPFKIQFLFSFRFHIVFCFSSVLVMYDNYTRQTNRVYALCKSLPLGLCDKPI
jgi:hypothetical protein